MPWSNLCASSGSLLRVSLPALLALVASATILLANVYLARVNASWSEISGYVTTFTVLSQLALCYWLIGTYLRERRETDAKLTQIQDRLEETVQARTQELTRLSRHLLTVREEEKARIARELHDELGSSLTAVNMDLAWVRQRLNDQVLATRLARAAEVLTSTVEMKRRIIQDLRPMMLDNLGLSAAIESYAAEFSQRIGVPIEARVPDELPQLKEGCPIALFRIFEEALTNASRHAQATRIDVFLRQEGALLILEVVDNGIGFDVSAQSPDLASHGLLEMRERALQTGGALIIERGRAGHGTTLRVELPCVV